MTRNYGICGQAETKAFRVFSGSGAFQACKYMTQIEIDRDNTGVTLTSLDLVEHDWHDTHLDSKALEWASKFLYTTDNVQIQYKDRQVEGIDFECLLPKYSWGTKAERNLQNLLSKFLRHFSFERKAFDSGHRMSFDGLNLSDYPAEIVKDKVEQVNERVLSLKTQDEILDLLAEYNYGEHINEFRRYLGERGDHIENEENPNIDYESLQAAAKFLLVHSDINYSGLRADSDGHIDIEWCLSSENIEDDPDDSTFWGDGEGAMAIKFISGDAIEFALLSGPYGQKKRAERINISGVLSHSKMNCMIRMFISRMIPYDLE